MPLLRVLLPLFFGLGAAACTTRESPAPPPEEPDVPPSLAVTPEVKSADEALARARACVREHPEAYRAVWGTELVLDQAKASATSGGDWLVTIPESGRSADGGEVALGAPRGRDVVVHRWTRECAPAAMD